MDSRWVVLHRTLETADLFPACAGVARGYDAGSSLLGEVCLRDPVLIAVGEVAGRRQSRVQCGRLDRWGTNVCLIHESRGCPGLLAVLPSSLAELRAVGSKVVPERELVDIRMVVVSKHFFGVEPING